MASDSFVSTWLGHGWLLLVSFSVALPAVFALRRPFRRLFGAQRAFQLWLLPPLLMIASQLPHAAGPIDASWSTVISMLTTADGAEPERIYHGSIVDWRAASVLVWLAGGLVCLAVAARAQRRYLGLMKGAVPAPAISSHYPVWRALRDDVGPALVGAWRPRIVVPYDFFDRYDATECALILAHEAAHARRGDIWWCLLARLIVAGLWFYPVAWLAVAAMRQDQELACDAAVLQTHRGLRRSYARAMLKTQSAAWALPVGCLWSPRHPMTERISMLKFSRPGKIRRVLGAMLLAAIVAGGASSVYAASNAGEPAPSSSPSLYQMAVHISRSGKNLATATVCVKAGERAGIRGEGSNGIPAWQFDLVVQPMSESSVQVSIADSAISVSSHATTFHPVLIGPYGEPMIVRKGGADDALELAITPNRNCPISAVTMRTHAL
jgi:beta-lactamase regulating signal transducer with metallopeptidase domain